jgi:EAL domain-containing protein (putative c-di-GMP-specific phosphodiesterase class I)
VRISKDTLLDKSLIGWLETQLKSLKIDPKRLCIQVTEELANQYVRQTKELAAKPAQARLPLRARALRHRPRPD